MRDNTLTSIVILALNLSSEVEDKKAISEHFNIEHTSPVLQGCYKGQTENSYIIEINELENRSLTDILAFSKIYNQESILFLDNQRNATLIFNMDEMIKLGTFKGVSELHAKSKDAYTYSPHHDVYFIAE